MNHKIFSVALIIVSLAFFLGQLARIPLSNDIAIILLDVVISIVVGGWLLRLLIIDYTFHKLLSSKYTKPLFLFFVVCLLSLILNIHNLKSSEVLVSFLYLVRLIVYYICFIFFAHLTNGNKATIIRAMTYVGLGIVMIGYLQLLLYPDLRNLIYLGWDDHYYRMVATFIDPNFAGIFFVLYFLFLSEKLRKNTFQDRRAIIFLSGTVILTFFAIFLTYSRTSILALVVATSIYLILIKKIKYVIALILIGGVLMVSLANTHYESLNPFRTASINARLIAGEKAIVIIEDNPLFGVGYNAYRYALKRYDFASKGTYPQHGEAGTDNSFLFITATTGVVGLVSFLYLWGTIFIQSRKYPLLIASMAVVFIGSLFINAIFYPFILFWMITLISTTQSNEH